MLKAIRPDGESVLYGHDAAGNTLSVTPPGQPARLFGYTEVDAASERRDDAGDVGS